MTKPHQAPTARPDATPGLLHRTPDRCGAVLPPGSDVPAAWREVADGWNRMGRDQAAPARPRFLPAAKRHPFMADRRRERLAPWIAGVALVVARAAAWSLFRVAELVPFP